MKRLRRMGLYDFSWEGPDVVYVGRPSKWGNPFKVKEYGLKECLRRYEEWLNKKLEENPSFLDELRGKNLVCWCPLDKPCHADILIEYAKKIRDVVDHYGPIKKDDSFMLLKKNPTKENGTGKDPVSF